MLEALWAAGRTGAPELRPLCRGTSLTATVLLAAPRGRLPIVTALRDVRGCVSCTVLVARIASDAPPVRLHLFRGFMDRTVLERAAGGQEFLFCEICDEDICVEDVADALERGWCALQWDLCS